MVELLQIFAHLVEHILNRDVYFFHYAFVDVPYYLLDDFELLEQFATGLQNILGEHVFFAIYPKVGKALLSRVEDLRQIT